MAAQWYRKAADQGDSDAQYNLGVAYDEGEGVPQDHQQAVAWYRKAAAQNHVRAQFNLAVSYDDGEGVVFRVHNAVVIAAEVQENIFHRRFSTKGEARGVGTYSMLLLSERYLKGSVGFSSSEATGTTFFLRLPKQLEMS